MVRDHGKGQGVKDIFKQRLVGALILVALGVVFWPIIFVEQGDRQREERAAIPPRPAVETTPIERPALGELRASPELQARREDGLAEETLVGEIPDDAAGDAPDPGGIALSSAGKGRSASIPDAAGGAAATPEVRTRAQAPESPRLDAQGVPVAWILQVATVSSAAKAEQLRKQLLAIDEKAYVKRLRRGDKDLYRVYIGPKFERARLEALKPRIDEKFRVTSLVVRYLP
jgi:DedD protein